MYYDGLMSLTFEVGSLAHHEVFDGLNLGQVTVFVLFLYVAVGPVSKKEPHTVRPQASGSLVNTEG